MASALAYSQQLLWRRLGRKDFAFKYENCWHPHLTEFTDDFFGVPSNTDSIDFTFRALFVYLIEVQHDG